MSQTVIIEQADTLVEAITLLREMIVETIASDKSRVTKNSRVGVVINNAVDPLEWLSSLDVKDKTYWSDRDGNFEMAGIGIADLITGGDDYSITDPVKLVQQRLAGTDSAVRYFGGLSFQGIKADKMWQKFGTARFILPRIELVRNKSESKLICNLVLPEDKILKDQIVLSVEKLKVGSKKKAESSLITRTDLPAYDNWALGVKKSLSAISEKKLEKIVLGRKSIFEFDNSLSALEILNRLKKASPGCCHFCFEPDESISFIGASPELLYSRQGQKIKSEAIAGTRSCGVNEADDNFLAEQLRRSEKDIREHNYVSFNIKKALEKLCDSLTNGGQIDILKLTRVQHLVSRFEGFLKADITDSDILCALHPTPAVGGVPTAEAMEMIAELEPFERGWYASPVGWIGAEATEFAVAIRSGLIENNQLVLYSGAGIVAGSEPEKEWDEIESKISNFLGVIKRS